jgi:DNA-binding transcriptional MerR regulator
MPPKQYTPAQVQKMLGIPASTLRRYSQLFADFLSTPARTGRKRYYTNRDITVISEIKRLSEEGVKIQNIPARLGEIVDLTDYDDQPDQEVVDLALPQVFQRFDKYDRRLNDIERSQADQLDYIRRLREYNRLPWWKRLFRSPPE